ncbi:hypothetical protein N0V84_003805 [Fusarium piperis]|uniref:Uncharacterized protein n=1 Tax=Fusarium piperis TaxID=1435070 RepID=A0A9W8WGR1_9HYPO|nr:hypothetical protein N0V84_003805 [Fusarium piperis]
MRLMCNFNTQQYVCTSALSSNLADWGDWGKLYQELLVQRRIWDFRDLFTAASAAFGLDSAQEQFLKGRKLTAALDQDWCQSARVRLDPFFNS